MEPVKRSFQKCVKDLIGLVLDSGNHDLIFREFKTLEPGLKNIKPEVFFREFVPAKLALGCVFWVACCASHRIEDRVLTNLFFKEVMGLFESPSSLGDATRFSESLYASNADAEQSPVLGVLVHLFHKLGLSALIAPGRGGGGELTSGFRFLMETCEGLKNAFLLQFDDFLYSSQEFHSQGRKKG